MSTYQNKRGTNDRWTSQNLVLAEGEIGVNLDDTSSIKIGDGITPWNDLSYAGSNPNIVTGITFSDNYMSASINDINMRSSLLGSVAFNELVNCFGAMTLSNLSNALRLDLPKLQYAFSLTISANPLLSNISFDNLGLLDSSLNLTSMAGLTAVSMSSLTSIGSLLTISTSANLRSLNFPSLVTVSGNFNLSLNLTSMDFNNLATVTGSFTPNVTGLTACSFPALVSTGAFTPSFANATSANLNNLTTITGAFNPASLAALTSLSMPALATVTSTFTLSSSSITLVSAPSMITVGTVSFTMSSLTNTTGFWTVGTLKSVGGNITMSNASFTQASVDHILAVVASLDGTNGTTSWGTGKSLNLTGANMATPSATGLSNKAIIVARGGTVTNH